MYAMLTGNLPFTVEPFNIKMLHSKMLKGDVNPLPDHLTSCKWTRPVISTAVRRFESLVMMIVGSRLYLTLLDQTQ